VATTEPATAHSDGGRPQPHRRLWRSALLVGGGAAGVVVGIALSIALARPASAATLPAGSPVPVAPSALSAAPPAGAATGVVTTASTAALAAVPPVVAKVVSPLPLAVDTAVKVVADPVTATLVKVALPVTGLPIVPLAALGPSPDGALGPWPSAVGHVLAASTVPASHLSAGPAHLNGVLPSSWRAPVAPEPAPTGPYPSPLPLLTAIDSSGASSPSQGNSPFGSSPRRACCCQRSPSGECCSCAERDRIFFSMRGAPLLVSRSCCTPRPDRRSSINRERTTIKQGAFK
jgi:hypothetical protein